MASCPLCETPDVPESGRCPFCGAAPDAEPAPVPQGELGDRLAALTDRLEEAEGLDAKRGQALLREAHELREEDPAAAGRRVRALEGALEVARERRAWKERMADARKRLKKAARAGVDVAEVEEALERVEDQVRQAAFDEARAALDRLLDRLDFSGSPQEARRRLRAAQKRIEYARERGGDTARADRLLAAGEKALEAGDLPKARDLASQASQAAEDARKRARAQQLIVNAERKLAKAEERGADVAGGREYIEEAQKALQEGLYADVQKRTREARDFAETARRRKVAEDSIHRTEKILEAEAGEGSDVSEATPLLEEAWRAVAQEKFGTVPKLLHKASRIAEEAKRLREATEALEVLETEVRDLRAMKASTEPVTAAVGRVQEALETRNWKAFRKHLQTAQRAAEKARKERERELTLTVVEQLVERAGTGGVSALGARELLEEVEKALGRGRYTDIDTLVEAKFEAEATKKENEVLRQIAAHREAMTEMKVAGLEVSAAAGLLEEAEAALKAGRLSESEALVAKAGDTVASLREALVATAERTVEELREARRDLADLEVTASDAEEFAQRAEEALEADDAFQALDLARLGLEACQAARKAHFDALAAREVEDLKTAAARKEAREVLERAQKLATLLDRADLDPRTLREAVRRAAEALEGEDPSAPVKFQVVEELVATLREALEARLRDWTASLEEAVADLAEAAREALEGDLQTLRDAVEDGHLEAALEASLALEQEVLEAREAGPEGAEVPPADLKRVSGQFVKVKRLLESLRKAGIDVTESQEQFREAEAALQRRDLARAEAALVDLEETATAIQSDLAQAARDFIAAARLRMEKAARLFADVPEAREMLRQAEELFEETRFDESIELARLAERKTRARMEKAIDEAQEEVTDRLEDFEARVQRLRDAMTDLDRADIAIEGAPEGLVAIRNALEEADFERAEEHLSSLEEMAEILRSGLEVAAQDLLAVVDRQLDTAQGEGLPVPRGRQVIGTAREALADGRYVEALEYCKVIEDIVEDARRKATLEDLRKTMDSLRDDLDHLQEQGFRWDQARELLDEMERAAKEGYLDRALALQEGLQGLVTDLRASSPEPEDATRVQEALQTLREAQAALETGEAEALAEFLTQARLQLGEDRGEAVRRLAEEIGRTVEVAESAGLSVDEAREVFVEAQGLLEEDPVGAREALQRARRLVRKAAEDLPEEAGPVLYLEMPEEGLEEGRWTRFRMDVRNVGKTPARTVTVRLRGDVEVREPDPIPELGPGEARPLEMEVRPRSEGDIPVQVEVTHRGFFDDRTASATMDRRVRAAPRGTYVVEDVFLVHSDGRLVCHDTRKPEDQIDEDIFSGMLTVVQDFVKDSFRQRTDLGLRRLEFGDSKILIERGKHVYLAAVLTGDEPPLLPLYMVELINEIERKFGAQLERWTGLLRELEGVEAIAGKLCYFTSDQGIRGPEAASGLDDALRMIRGGRALGLDVSESEALLQEAQEAVEEDTERAWALVQDAVERALTSQQDLQRKLERSLASLDGDLQGLAHFGRPHSGSEEELERARRALARGEYDLAARVVGSLEESLSVLKEEVAAEQVGSALDQLHRTLRALEREGADTGEARDFLERARHAMEEGHLGEVARHLEGADEASRKLRRTFLLDRQRQELERVRQVYEEAAAQGLADAEAREIVDRATEAAERADVDELEALMGLARETILAPVEGSLEGKEARLTVEAPPAVLQADRWTRYEIRLVNEGNWPAQDVRLDLGEEVEVRGETTVDRLDPGEARNLELGLKPTGTDDAAVDLRVEYARSLDRSPRVTHYLRDFRVASPGTYLVEDVLLLLPDGRVAVHETRSYREALDRESVSNMLATIQEFLGDVFQDGRRVGIKRMEFGDSRVLMERGERAYLAAIVAGKEEPDLLPVYMLQVLQEAEEVYGDVLADWPEGGEPPEGLRAIVRKVLLVTDDETAELGPLARSPVTARLLYGLPKAQRRERVEALLPQLQEALEGEGLDAGMEVVESALEVPERAGGTLDIDDEALREYIEAVKEIDQAVRKARGKAGLEYHWPVSRIAIRAKTETVASAATNFKSMILSHANAKEVDILQAGDIWRGVDLKMQIHQEALSKAYKVWAKKIELILKSQDPWKIKAGIERGGYEMGIEGQVIEIGPEMVTFQVVLPPHIVVQEFSDGMVFLDTRMTEETQADGFANEIVKIVLEARKDLGLPDRKPVEVRLTVGDKLRRLLGMRKTYVEQEVHARELRFVDDVGEQGFVADVELAGEAFSIAVLPAT